MEIDVTNFSDNEKYGILDFYDSQLDDPDSLLKYILVGKYLGLLSDIKIFQLINKNLKNWFIIEKEWIEGAKKQKKIPTRKLGDLPISLLNNVFDYIEIIITSYNETEGDMEEDVTDGFEYSQFQNFWEHYNKIIEDEYSKFLRENKEKHQIPKQPSIQQPLRPVDSKPTLSEVVINQETNPKQIPEMERFPPPRNIYSDIDQQTLKPSHKQVSENIAGRIKKLRKIKETKENDLIRKVEKKKEAKEKEKKVDEKEKNKILKKKEEIKHELKKKKLNGEELPQEPIKTETDLIDIPQRVSAPAIPEKPYIPEESITPNKETKLNETSAPGSININEKEKTNPLDALVVAGIITKDQSMKKQQEQEKEEKIKERVIDLSEKKDIPKKPEIIVEQPKPLSKLEIQSPQIIEQPRQQIIEKQKQLQRELEMKKQKEEDLRKQEEQLRKQQEEKRQEEMKRQQQEEILRKQQEELERQKQQQEMKKQEELLLKQQQQELLRRQQEEELLRQQHQQEEENIKQQQMTQQPEQQQVYQQPQQQQVIQIFGKQGMTLQLQVILTNFHENENLNPVQLISLQKIKDISDKFNKKGNVRGILDFKDTMKEKEFILREIRLKKRKELLFPKRLEGLREFVKEILIEEHKPGFTEDLVTRVFNKVVEDFKQIYIGKTFYNLDREYVIHKLLTEFFLGILKTNYEERVRSIKTEEEFNDLMKEVYKATETQIIEKIINNL